MKTKILKTIGMAGLMALSVYLTISMNVSIEKHRGHILIGGVQQEVLAATPKYVVELHVFYNPKDTIILFNDQDPESPLYVEPAPTIPYDGAGYRANYPQIDFITFILLIRDTEDNILKLYEGEFGPLGVIIDLADPDSKQGYIDKLTGWQLMDLTTEGLTLFNSSNALPQEDLGKGIVNWKGFYFALDKNDGLQQGIESLKYALAESNMYTGVIADEEGKFIRQDAPCNSIQFYIGEADPMCFSVIGVKSWNCEETIKQIPFRITCPSYGSPQGVIYAIYVNGKKVAEANQDRLIAPLSIDLDIDNVNFIRENSGAAIGEDPGKFIVAGVPASLNRYYSNILELMVRAAHGEFNLPGENGYGPDWLQTAAADILNNPPNDKAKAVFDSVEWIFVRFAKPTLGDEGYGYVFPSRPKIIGLKANRNILRFNLGVYAYGMMTNKGRTVIAHEAHHSWMLGSGKANGDVRDEEKEGRDWLFVGKDGVNPPPFFRYAWDHKDAGFVLPEDDGTLGQKWGDGIKYEGISSGFTQLFFADLIPYDRKEFSPSIPQYLPYDALWVPLVEAFFYSPETKKRYQPPEGEGDIVFYLELRYEQGSKIIKPYGEFFPARFTLVNNVSQNPSPRIRQLAQQGYKLHVIYKLAYKSLPCEYDATYFNIGGWLE